MVIDCRAAICKAFGGYAALRRQRSGRQQPARRLLLLPSRAYYNVTRKFYAAARFSQIFAPKRLSHGRLRRHGHLSYAPLTDRSWRLSLGLGYRFSRISCSRRNTPSSAARNSAAASATGRFLRRRGGVRILKMKILCGITLLISRWSRPPRRHASPARARRRQDRARGTPRRRRQVRQPQIQVRRARQLRRDARLRGVSRGPVGNECRAAGKTGAGGHHAKKSPSAARCSRRMSCPIVVGTTVEWPNYDEILHNVFSMSEPKPFDLELYKGPGRYKRVDVRQAGRVDVFCSIHAKMSCVVLVLENPYFATADEKGRYAIANVPARHLQTQGVARAAARAGAGNHRAGKRRSESRLRRSASRTCRNTEQGSPWNKLRAKIIVSFRAKVLVPVVAVMVLLLAVTVWVVNARITQQVRDRSPQALATADAVFRHLQIMRNRTRAFPFPQPAQRTALQGARWQTSIPEPSATNSTRAGRARRGFRRFHRRTTSPGLADPGWSEATIR